MDLATIFGFISGVVILVAVLIMDGGSPAELFAHPSALLLIIGGSIAATTISSPLSAVKKLPRLLLLSAFGKRNDPRAAIEVLVKMADKARREGLLALEDESKKIDDPFLQKGVMLLVDGVDPNQVRDILDKEIEHMVGRHREGSGLFLAAGGFAPTFGIIGTVMGLIGVLKQLDDPSSLAHAIAGAFLATLWGLLSSNLIFLPIGAKLKSKSDQETKYREMLMEGVLSLQAGENPRILREKLNTFLPPNTRSSKSSQSAVKEKSQEARA